MLLYETQKGPNNWLSSRTSGHKHCRVEKVNCRVALASLVENDFVLTTASRVVFRF